MNIISAFLQRQRLACAESWQCMVAKPLTSGLAVLALGVTMMLCSLAWASWQNLIVAEQHWQQNISIALFLKPTVAAEQAQALEQQLQTQSQLIKPKLILPNEALQTLNHTWQDVLQALPENPLPAVIEMNFSESLLNQPQALKQTLAALQQRPEVETLQFDLDSITHSLQLFNFTKQLLIGVMLLLGLVAILTGLQSLHLLLSHFWRELHLRLSMGATRRNIILPLIYMGVWCGLIAALLAVGGAVLVVNLAQRILIHRVDVHFAVLNLNIYELILPLFISALLGGFIVKLACNRQLKEP